MAGTHFLIVVLGMLFPIAILAIIFGYENSREKRFHETMKRLVDNGQTLDEETLSGIPGYKKKEPRDDIRSGLITSAVGLGLFLLGSIALGSVVIGAGLLVLCIGLGLFGYGYVTEHTDYLKEKKD